MANDLGRLAKNLRVRGERLVKNADTLTRKVLLLVDTALVVSTPVDTGRARANWQAALGSTPTGVIPTPSTPGEGATRALGEAQGVAAAYRGSGDIHIANNVPYISRLNDGSSTQAPAGFVEEAIVKAVDAINASQGITSRVWVENIGQGRESD